MRGLPTATYQEFNNSAVSPSPLLGVHAVILPTLLGPADKPYEIASLDDFTSTFGGVSTASSPYFAQIKRYLQRGGTLWVQRLLATGNAQANYVFASKNITAKALNPGLGGNAITLEYVTLAAGAGTAKLLVHYPPDTTKEETWTGTTLDALIAAVNAGSELITLTTTVGYAEPVATTVPLALGGGADGTFASTAARDVAVQALFSNFNDIIGLSSIFAMGSYSAAHLLNLKTYAATRADLMGLFEVDPSLSIQAAAAFLTTVNSSVYYSSFIAIYFGSLLTAYSKEDGANVAGPVLLDVAGVYAFSDTLNGNTNGAPAGPKRGLIPNVLSFSNNLLSPARKPDANQLALLGANIVGIDFTYGPLVFGADTFANSGSALDAINVRRMLFALRNDLQPIYNAMLFEPQNPTTWRKAYLAVISILDNYVATLGINPGYTYVGDQEASSAADATYNSQIDLANGKYKAQITVTPVGFIHDLVFQLEIDALTTAVNVTVAS